MPARTRRLPGSLVAALLLFPLAAAPARATVFDEEIAARRAELLARAGAPGAVVTLLGALDLWDWVDDRGAITALLDAAKDDPRQRHEVRARAAFLRSLAADRTGDREGAARLRAGIGLLTEWLVLGPFDNEGRAGDRARLAPERDLAALPDEKTRYDGVQHAVSWRRYPARRLKQGMVVLDAALQPEQHVVGYATTLVRVERDVIAALRLGSSGAVTVWAGGERVFTNDVYRPVRLDQDAAAVRLRAGWNRITVKLGADEGGWGFLLRLTTLDGQRLPFTATAETARATGGRPLAARGSRAAPALPAPADLRRDLKAAADEGRRAAQRDYGLYLHHVAPEDPRQGTAERLLAFAAEGADDIASARSAAMAAADPDRTRKWLEEASAPARSGTRGERARVLSMLGRMFDRLHRERRAEELMRAALAQDPDYFPAALALAEQVAEHGLPARATALVAEVARTHGGVIAVLSAQASLAERLGRSAEAEALLRRVLAASRDDSGTLRQLEAYARGRGEVDAAVELLTRLADARPDAADLVLEQAKLLDGVGRGAEAHRLLSAALEDCPDAHALLALDGRVLHRLGRGAEALRALRRALELHPQDAALRSYLAMLEAGAGADEGEDLAREFALPVEQLLERAKKEPPPVSEPVWVLLDRQVTRVHRNGLSQTFNQRVVQVLDERGAREQAQTAIRYTPDSQIVELRAARVHKPSGDVVEAPATTDQDTSEPWYGLYYDTHAQVIDLPHLEPGDVVDVEYLITDVSARNMFGDYFGDLRMVQEDAPRLASDYMVIAPRARPLYCNRPELPGLRADVVPRGDDLLYRWQAERVPRIQAEPGMPGVTSVGAYVHVSTYESWEKMAQWYAGLVREQLVPDEDIRRAVADTLKEVSERTRAGRHPGDERSAERARIGAIYDLVVRSTRYVALEFGIHGYKPYRVSDVFRRKFGDCKDKASLLVAMLELAGVDASLVLVRTRRGGDIAPYPASLAPFDHAIAWVPKYDLFLDGTAEFSGSGELPAGDQDVPVLIIDDPRTGGRGHLVRTPVPPAEQNRVSRTLEVALAPSGAARVKLAMTVAGQAAHEWRNHYQSPGERRDRFEKGENAAHPGTRVERVTFASLEDLEAPVQLEAEMEVPAWARREGASLALPALGREGELLRNYARLSARRHDLVLGYPWSQEERVTVSLPEGLSWQALPLRQAVDSPFGSFVLAVERDDGARRVIVSASLALKRHRVGAAEYPAFRRFCLDVDRLVATTITAVVPGG